MNPAANILVTRPSPYGEDLCQQLSQQDFSSQHLPLIDFVENKKIDSESIFQQLSDNSIWIFVSQQAVRYTLEKLTLEQISQLKNQFSTSKKDNSEKDTSGKASSKKIIIAVGSATQKILHQFGFLSLLPKTPNSEGMLKLIDDLHLPTETRICLIRGDQGRELLQQQLDQSFKFTILSVYHRRPLSISTFPETEKPCAIVITSKQLLDLTINLLNSAKLTPNNFAIISGSSRITDIAYQKGFANCYTATSMSNSDLLQACVEWRKDMV